MSAGATPSRTVRSAPPAEKAFRALLRAFGLLRRAMDPHFARFGISGVQWGVLRVLHRAEGGSPLRLTDLGNSLLIRPPSVTGVIDRLERRGLVRRAASTADRRERLLRLTPAGRRLVRRVLVGRTERLEGVMGGLTPRKQELLRRLLERLSDHLAASVEPGTPRPHDRPWARPARNGH